MPITKTSPKKTIRVMTIDDSLLARRVIMDGLKALPNIEMVGYAVNAMDARNKLLTLQPDVITLDVEMPGISGIDFLKTHLTKLKIPVILVSSLNLRVFDALAAGAVDFVRKPTAEHHTDSFIRALAQKILIASQTRPRSLPPLPKKTVVTPPAPLGKLGTAQGLEKVIIGLGASTGGTEATLEILRQLPADIPPMVVVQHMPAGFTKMYADRLNRICAMDVKEAEHGDSLRRGLVLVAPAELQARVVHQGGRYTLSCTREAKVSGHAPSVDVLFSSMAANVRCAKVGIILTGMGRDGANGLLAMRKSGAYTIGQDKASCVVYGMPMVANDIGAVQIQASCDAIAGVLLKHLKSL